MNPAHKPVNEALPATDLVVASFKFVWGRRRIFLLLAGWPVFLSSLLPLLMIYLLPAQQVAIETLQDLQAYLGNIAPVVLAFALAKLLIVVIFSVAWYRYCLLPENNPTVGTALKWDSAKTRFLMVALLLLSMIFLVISLLPVVGLPVALLLAARLSLFLPGVAIGDAMALDRIWKMGAGNSWRLAWIFLLSGLGTIVAIVAFAMIAGNILSATGMNHSISLYFVKTLFLSGLDLFGLAVGIGALAGAYKHLLRKTG